MNPFLQVIGLTKTFVNGNISHTAFKDVNFELAEGDFLCILGQSGSGKSTLLRCIGGFETASEGQVLVNGSAITKPGIQASMIFQSFDQLFPWKTVQGNVLFPLQQNKAGGSTDRERLETVNYYLELVGLAKFRDFYPHQLSGGMKQRVAIARSLAQKPSIILMDEPFASLDADSRTSLQKELLNIWRSTDITVLFVTHSIIEAIGIGSKFLVMGNDEGLKLMADNPVKSERGVLRTPESEGFSECWAMLKNIIRN